MIDLTVNEEQLKKNIEVAKENNIILPTLEQQKNPELIPDEIKKRLKDIDLWEINSNNLFRITWQNEPKKDGGQYSGVNFVELPSELTGVDARIIALVGKWFPTGAHKVGATYGCLVPKLVTGQFAADFEKAVWPSTGNYCRGGAYNSVLLACDSIAILPEGMSQERFDWLSGVADEVIPTPGTESNVKEIFDKCWELKETREDINIFNQFEEFGNHLWHYEVTGDAMEKVLNKVMGPEDNYAGITLTTGSAGTIGVGDYLKELYPASKVLAGEALQCPTLLYNGFGAHRIEGIGDKHVPWIHNVKNTDMVAGIDDNDCMDLLRLFNEPAGQEYLKEQGVSKEVIEKLSLLGISSIANVISAIKFAKYSDLTENDIVLTVFTDSMEMYQSRLEELEEERGSYKRENAVSDYHKSLMALETDYLLDLSYRDKERIHNLKYYTWIEQQGRETKELNAQWHEAEDYWDSIHNQTERIDELIKEFNERTGLLKDL
ncbi:pyridoxal-5-phosphate-dependent protein subunit beta [Sporohalobacter salinus]|uniref:pyridoxal-5-phosphate-dependent protein subunit beta n=1 Tax=Sporohalobacter salinus TaxID=1494606 RepID=UPI0019620FA2|nr:pyridoxal-5-phosphate-dependent protein subunit beta [Sporohalobacter salinus]MBM7622487.1 cysteine synthase [Sporohalobacter salinus]